MQGKTNVNIVLTTDEKKYIRGIIHKCLKKCIVKDLRISLSEPYSIDDLDFDKKQLAIEDTYKFYDNKIPVQYNVDQIDFSQGIKIIKAIDSILKETDLSFLIKTLDSFEKIVLYLLYEKFDVKKIAKLLYVAPTTVYYRIRKIRKMIGEKQNGKTF